MQQEIKLVLFAVRNNEGKFFRAKGYGGGGNSWVEDINKAKIYGKIGGARGTITWFANNYPKYQTPELLKLTVTGVEVIDDSERVKKAQDKKVKDNAKKDKRNAEYRLEMAQKDLINAQNKIKQLTKR